MKEQIIMRMQQSHTNILVILQEMLCFVHISFVCYCFQVAYFFHENKNYFDFGLGTKSWIVSVMTMLHSHDEITSGLFPLVAIQLHYIV